MKVMYSLLFSCWMLNVFYTQVQTWCPIVNEDDLGECNRSVCYNKCLVEKIRVLNEDGTVDSELLARALDDCNQGLSPEAQLTPEEKKCMDEKGMECKPDNCTTYGNVFDCFKRIPA